MNNLTECKLEPISEHISVANQMAESIIEKFDPFQQNEMLKCIFDAIKSKRINMYSEAEKRKDYLGESLNFINSINL